MDEHRRLIKNTGMIAIGNMGTRLVSFLLLPLYTALLSTSEYGVIDYLVSIAMFCVPFVSLLMDESIFRFLIDCKGEEDRKKVITTAMLIVMVGMILFCVTGIPLMLVLHYEFTGYTTIFTLLNVLFGMLSALLRGIGRTDLFSFFNFLLGATQIFLNVFFIVYLRLGLTGMLLASMLGQGMVTLFIIRKARIWNMLAVKSIDVKLAKEMVLYSLPLIPNKISWTIINLSDRIIIMSVLGRSAAGLYAVAYKFPNLMDTVYGFFYQSWKESSARVLGDSRQEAFYNSVYWYLKNFMYSIVLGMAAFLPIVFRYIINKAYGEAFYYVPLLLLATYFSNISGFYGGIFTAYKDTKIMGITTIVAAFLNLVLHFSLILFIGMHAAALSTLAANFIVYAYRRVKLERYVHLRERWGEKAVSMMATALVVFMYYRNDMYMTVISCTISVAYAIVMNRRLIMALIRKMKGRKQTT
jgi:O-antigen/teichoic acid export membrane protein|nr:oligosaccharide flippase family protein [uncultured Acetatifactor sp.]